MSEEKNKVTIRIPFMGLRDYSPHYEAIERSLGCYVLCDYQGLPDHGLVERTLHNSKYINWKGVFRDYCTMYTNVFSKFSFLPSLEFKKFDEIRDILICEIEQKDIDKMTYAVGNRDFLDYEQLILDYLDSIFIDFNPIVEMEELSYGEEYGVLADLIHANMTEQGKRLVKISDYLTERQERR